MTFLHVWALAVGVPAVVLPVVIHLLTRPRPTRMPLSTLRFVREAIRQRRARHWLRDLVILALRAAAVLLLALALARPQWGENPLVSDLQPGDAVRVVIVDVSQSMAAAEHGIGAMERARSAAGEHLRYRPGLKANLILAGATPQAAMEQPSTNFGALADALGRAEPLPERTDARKTLELAARMLARSSPQDQRRRELVIVSDFQRSTWGSADFSVLPPDTRVQLESVAAKSPLSNLAILRTDCRLAGSQGGSGQLAVELGNYSPVPQRVAVEADLDGATYRLEGTCLAGRRTTLWTETLPHAPGWLSGQVKLVGVDDALAADNVRGLVAQVRSKPAYVLISRQPAAMRPSSSHFLECGLVPDAQLKDQASARLVRTDPASLDRPAVAAADLIVLDHPGRLSAETIGFLAGLSRRGRPMLYVAAEAVDAMNLRQLSDAAQGGLHMPVEFVPPPAASARKTRRLASVRHEEPPFAVFGDKLAAVTGRLEFAGGLKSRRVEGGLHQEVLATYDDGSACLVLTASDAGVLAVLNADLAGSSLPKSPAFVPLLAELVEPMLDRGRGSKSAVCGEPMVVELPQEAGAAAGLKIVGPDAARPGAASEVCGEMVNEGAGVVWRWSRPTRPGVYRVERDGRTVFAISLEVPPEESQLDTLPLQVLKERLGGGRDVYVRQAGAEAERRDDLWTWLLTGCVAALLAQLAALLVFRT